MKKIPWYLLILSLAGMCYSFNTSSESVNPFNQYMAPAGGVNMFSGDVAFSQPLVSLKGRAGMDVNVAFSYSSNVYLNVRAKNDIAPTGWLGLGWNMSYGSVVCDHKGTKSTVDDDFYYLGPGGYPDPILKDKGNKWRLKTDPYTTCSFDTSAKGIITNWVFSMLDGKKIFFGNCGDASQQATRYTFCWGNYVGQTFSGAPDSFPYRWDVSKIEDVLGNKIRFEYSQKKEYLQVHAGQASQWTSPFPYTKASYVKKIFTPDSSCVEFKLIAKQPAEYVDPYTFGPEPDGFIEMFEDSLLDSVKVFSMNGTVSKKIKIGYEKINQGISGNFLKSVLSSITEMNGAGAKSGVTRFVYNTDFSKADKDDASHYDSNYNYGAIASVTSPLGGTKTFSYARKSIAADKQVHVMGSPTPNVIQGPVTNYLKDGSPYAMWTNNTNIWVYNWNGSRWVKTFDSDLGDSYDKQIFPGNGYFVVTSGITDAFGKISVYNWDGHSWVSALRYKDAIVDIFYKNALEEKYTKSIRIGKDYFIVILCSDGKAFNRILLFQRNGNEWVTQKLPQQMGPESGLSTGPTELGRSGDPKEAYCMDDYLIIQTGSMGTGSVCVFQKTNDTVPDQAWKMAKWKDPEWSDTTIVGWFHWFNSSGQKAIFPGLDYFVVTYNNGSGSEGYVRLFQWDGSYWESKKLPSGENKDWNGLTNLGTKFGTDDEKAPHIQQNHCLIKGGSNKLYVLDRKGGEWVMGKRKVEGLPSSQYPLFCDTILPFTDTTFLHVTYPNGKQFDLYREEDYFVISSDSLNDYRDTRRKNALRLFKWNGAEWEFQPLPVLDASNHIIDTTNGPTNDAVSLGEATVFGDINGRKKVHPSKDFFILENVRNFNENFECYSGMSSSFSIFNRNGDNWQLDTGYIGKKVHEPSGLEINLGHNFFLLRPCEDETVAWLYTWNGKSWIKNWENTKALSCSTALCMTTVPNTNPGADFFTLKERWAGSGEDTLMVGLFQKFQDDFTKPIYTYSCTSMTVSPIVPGTKPNTTKYEWNDTSGNYQGGTAKYNKVETVTPGSGKTVSYFFNHTAADHQNTTSNYYQFDGLVYKTETYQEGDAVPLAKGTTAYELYRDTANWHEDVYQKRVSKTTSVTQGVTSENLIVAYNNTNGLPYISTTKNSDGSGKTAKTFFAYEAKKGWLPAYLGINMTQTCQTTVDAAPLVYYVHPQIIINVSPGTTTIPINLSSNELLKFKRGDTIEITFTVIDSSISTSLFLRVNNSNILVGTFGLPYTFTFTYGIMEPSISSLSLVFSGNKTVKIKNLVITNMKNVLKGKYAVASSVTTFQPVNGVWLPSVGYSWNVKLDSLGMPDPADSLIAFYFDPNATNDSRWNSTGGITRYNSFGMAVETVDPYSVYSNTVYGTKALLPIGAIKNATSYESGIFTGDYNLDQDAFFDKFNGWEQSVGNSNNITPCSVSLVGGNLAHFGDSCVKVVNSFGPTRNCRLTKGRDYVFSAWVKAEAGVLYLGGDYRKILKSADVVWPVTSFNSSPNNGLFSTVGKSVTGPSSWQKISLTIPVSKDLKDSNWTDYNWYARIFVGTPSGGTAYIDDIRFHPIDAMATTTYYDSKWQQPVLAVDANNKPGNRVSYDNFGRPLIIHKIDASDPKNPVKQKIVSKKQYHLLAARCELLSPNGGEVLMAGDPAAHIQWEASASAPDALDGVNLYYSSDNGANWTLINTAGPIYRTDTAGRWGDCPWRIASGLSSDTCLVQIRTESGEVLAGSALTFCIRLQ